HNPEPLPPRFDYAVSIEGPLLSEIHPAARHLWMLAAWAHFNQRRTDYPTLRPVGKPCGSQLAAFVMRDNLRHRHDIEQAYLHAIANAGSEIIIASAYFLPGGNFRHALSAAVRRGVRVVLLLQGRVEHRLLHYATHALYGSLLDAGIEIHEYHKSYLHAKVAVIDRHWATVGSSNIDPFSLLLAREANVVVADASFAAELRLSLEQAMAEGSAQVLRESWKKQSWFIRTMSWVSYYVVRYLQGLVGYGRENDRPEYGK
ncbi:MAG: phospholipase D-like domain-containing protein, partial [Pseudomonadota bacterium]